MRKDDQPPLDRDHTPIKVEATHVRNLHGPPSGDLLRTGKMASHECRAIGIEGTGTPTEIVADVVDARPDEDGRTALLGAHAEDTSQCIHPLVGGMPRQPLGRPQAPSAERQAEASNGDETLGALENKDLVDIVRDADVLLAHRAYMELHSRYNAPLRRRARMLAADSNLADPLPQLAEDLAQDTWRKLWQRIRVPSRDEPFRLATSFWGVLDTTLRRLILDRLERQLPLTDLEEWLADGYAQGRLPQGVSFELECSLNQDEAIYAEWRRQLSSRARALVNAMRSGARKPCLPDFSGWSDDREPACPPPSRAIYTLEHRLLAIGAYRNRSATVTYCATFSRWRRSVTSLPV